MIELIVFVIAGGFAVIGALGVVLAKNPVHAALMLVMTLFSVAVLFLAQDAQFLAAVQIVVYAGAIVVLFLFVIMLLGVDQSEDLSVEPLVGQRAIAGVVGLAIAALAVVSVWGGATGTPTETGPLVDSITGTTTSAVEALPDDQTSGQEINANINQLGESIFTDYVFAFEITALLLTVAVVGAVVLARSRRGELADMPETALDDLMTVAPVAPIPASGNDADHAGEASTLTTETEEVS